MSGNPGFQGFREPPSISVNSPRWTQRVEALTKEDAIGKWATYGPYTSQSSAYRATAGIRDASGKVLGQHQLVDYMVEEEGEGWTVFVRVRYVGPNRANVRELKRSTG